MDPRIARLKTVKDCENFAKNALERGFPELQQKPANGVCNFEPKPTVPAPLLRKNALRHLRI
jgi:hypothetical protein